MWNIWRITAESRRRNRHLSQRAADVSDNRPEMPNQMQIAPLAGVTPKFMIVDDEPVIAHTLTHILNVRGFPCIAAYDGEEAIEKARQLRPKFILMGVVMPRMYCVEAALKIVI
jgi:PleD family two-component response regulator